MKSTSGSLSKKTPKNMGCYLKKLKVGYLCAEGWKHILNLSKKMQNMFKSFDAKKFFEEICIFLWYFRETLYQLMSLRQVFKFVKRGPEVSERYEVYNKQQQWMKSSVYLSSERWMIIFSLFICSFIKSLYTLFNISYKLFFNSFAEEKLSFS